MEVGDAHFSCGVLILAEVVAEPLTVMRVRGCGVGEDQQHEAPKTCSMGALCEPVDAVNELGLVLTSGATLDPGDRCGVGVASMSS